MCTNVRTLRFAACGWMILAWAPQESLACSVCLAGDPSFSNSGASAQQAGDFSMYFEVRGWEKQSGLLPHGDAALPEHEREDASLDGEAGNFVGPNYSNGGIPTHADGVRASVGKGRASIERNLPRPRARQ